MTQTLVFLAGVALVLMLLGHAFTPPDEKLPVREWTPVYLADRVGQGVKGLWTISRAQARVIDEMQREAAQREEEHRLRDERRRRREDGERSEPEEGGP